MGNSLRCCLACVLPCGALDLIRIVHLNGQVEEIAHPITAGEILLANPNHVLSKPSSQGSVVRRILILSPESELKRGTIYFLIPSTSLSEKKQPKTTDDVKTIKSSRKIKTDHFVSEKKSTRRDRRGVRTVVWRPHLDSITEDY